MAANTMPIPLPPRTPTPPPDEPTDGLGFDHEPHPFDEGEQLQQPRYDPRSLSPVRSTFTSHMAPSIPPPSPSTGERLRNPSNNNASPERRLRSTGSLASLHSNHSRTGSMSANSPFNFQPTALAKSPVAPGVKSVGSPRSPSSLTYLPICSSRMTPSPMMHRRIQDISLQDFSLTNTTSQNIGQRRGHKYKHSSVSHQIFLEPPPRAPLALPNSLPVPTFAECRASMTTDQSLRFWWSICHMLVAGYTAWNAHSSAAMEALSHLIFYDSLGALLCVAVEVLSNFEVWGRSSIRHPFGLERIEIIAGFALSVLLIFMGFDLVSHNAKHALEGIGHTPHSAHPHQHERVSAGTVDVTAALALASTLISAVGLKNHARIGKAMRFAAMENLPSVLSNPSHFLTLSCSATLLILPLLSLHMYEWIDKVLSLSIALAMCFLGVHLGKNVGSMLLMSYSGKGVDDVIRELETDPLVTKVEEAKFWQAHYGVGMANLRLRVSAGGEDGLLRLRERITSLVRNRLSGGYGRGGQKWEVSVQFRADKDHGNDHQHHHH